jgi:hypothetical protein
MRANNQGSPRLAEACRAKMIQGQNGVSQNSNATKGLYYAVTHNIVNMQHNQKVSLRKRHVSAIYHEREFAHPPRRQIWALRG